MNRRTLGMLATLVGSAISTWWVINQRYRRHPPAPGRSRDRGTVIFDNTPSAADIDAIV